MLIPMPTPTSTKTTAGPLLIHIATPPQIAEEAQGTRQRHALNGASRLSQIRQRMQRPILVDLVASYAAFVTLGYLFGGVRLSIAVAIAFPIIFATSVLAIWRRIVRRRQATQP